MLYILVIHQSVWKTVAYFMGKVQQFKENAHEIRFLVENVFVVPPQISSVRDGLLQLFGQVCGFLGHNFKHYLNTKWEVINRGELKNIYYIPRRL